MDELAGEPLRLLCSLPGIEANVISLIQQLSSYVSESRDREERVKRRVDELCAHVSELRGELSSLRQSAIAPMHVDQQQQKGEEVKESAASSTNSTRTLTGKSKPRANSEKKSKQQAEHVGTHTEPRTRSAATPWHAGKTVPSVDTETEYKDKANPVCTTNHSPKVADTQTNTVGSQHVPPLPVDDDSWQLVSSVSPRLSVRRGVIWIGNLRPAISIEQLESFIQQRALTANQQLTIFSSKLISKADGKAGARVTISGASVEALTQPNFWPRPVYARPWVFRDDQRNAADKQQQEQQQKTQENQHQESTLSFEQRNTADQQQQQKKRQEEHQKTQENQHQESTPEEHQHLQTEQQNLHTASGDSQCPASSDSQCPASNDSQCPASSDSQCPASNDSQSPASSDVHQDSGQHQPKLQDTSTTSAPARATPPRPGKRHAEDSPGSMSGIPCKMQPSSSSQ
ncbi:TPR-containing protein DDB_G0280363-like [Sycon ciliatum]|uniref:TPR-containing protein DDB_G0280363-like n=1 Tax=Sycon ciliatum TaxID=27933 RepID=UPI0031F60014